MLEEQAIALVEDFDEIMKRIINSCGLDILKLDAEEYQTMKLLFTLMDKSKEYILSNARQQDEINKKLNLILNKLESK